MSSTNGLHRVLYTSDKTIIDNHVLSGVNQLNSKLHTPVKLTTDMILAMTRKARHLRHSHLRHIFVVTEMTWRVT